MVTSEERPQVQTELPVLYEQDFAFMGNVKPGRGVKTLSWGANIFMAFCGVRGSGKSLAMALYIAHALISGKRVLSNMNVAFKLLRPDHSAPQTYCTEPLDMNALYHLQEGINNCLVAIDEIQYFSDSRKWQSTRNQLLNAIFYQIRKRGLDFVCTVKTPNWLDSRLRDMELDIIVQCCDWHFRSQEYPKGQYINLKFYDWSGTWTGQPWYASHKGQGNYDGMGMGIDPDAQIDIKFANRIWPIYHTEAVIDYFDTLKPLDKKDFDGSKGGSSKPTISEEVIAHDDEAKMLQTFVESLRNAGKTVIGTTEFWALAKQRGVMRDGRVLGKYLEPMGVGHKRGTKFRPAMYLLNHEAGNEEPIN